MSNKTKLIIGLLFLVQIGIVAYAYWESEEEKAIRLAQEAAFQAKFATFLENPKAVDSMDLSGQNINRLLDDMQQFENLQYLDISNNDFQYFPTELLLLPKLEVLKMDYNKVRDVDFINNNTLKRLSLNQNNITKIDDINALKSLEVIELNSNKLSKFPMIEQNSKIDSIFLSHNQLSTVFYISNKLEKVVHYVDLSYNNLAARNGLETIISHAEAINVRGNKFDEFPVNFLYGAGKVKYLDASDCGTRIFHVEDVYSYVIEDLNISNNYFAVTQNQLNQFSELKFLNLSNIEIDNLTLSLDSLEQLNLFNVTILSTDCIFNLPNLKELSVNDWFFDMYLDDFKKSPLEIINIIDENDLIDKASIQKIFPDATINIIKN